ncbi:hypothetical protein ACFFQF_32280 [Haladaptatus pallidirubidus]|uniref:Uncharacterized protein n=1 Tax=Haladaptatus pallidirubidus TaxID=1008152 RepID=A0AAV3UNN8_9EURY|nr:hypothetical protein [Haladaptatus pallidirubidus]
MRLVYRLTFPAEQINLVSPYLRESNSFLEFATLGDPDENLLPQFWVYGPERELLASRLANDRAVTDLSQHARCSDRVSYRVQWDLSADAVTPLAKLATTLHEQEATALFGRITPSEWLCLLHFSSRDAVIHFYTESGVSQPRLDHHTDLELKNHHP